MPPESRKDPIATGSIRIDTLAAIVWGIFLVVTTIQVVVSPREHSVYPILANAGESWSRREALYGDKRATHHIEFYRYSPSIAAILAPLSRLSLRTGGLIWRLGSAWIFLVGLAWWFRCLNPVDDGESRKRLGWLLLLTWPMSAASIHNSQSNPIVIGLLLIASAAVIRSRWSLAAFGIVAATAFKVYPISVGLLLVLIAAPRSFTLGRRIGIGLILAAFFPFLTQRSGYVRLQYLEWMRYLRTDRRLGVTIDFAYRDLRLPFRAFGLAIPDRHYMIAQLVGAAAAAVICWTLTRRRMPIASRTVSALGLGTLWMTLLGPATESCTYMLIAPSLAWGLIVSRREGHRTAFRFLCAAYALFLADPLSLLVPWGALIRNHGLLPAAGLLTLAGLVWPVGGAIPPVFEPVALSNRRRLGINPSAARIDPAAGSESVTSAVPVRTSATYQGSR